MVYQETFVQRDQHRIYVRDHPGAEPTIVVMHGFPDNLHLYDRLLPHLSPPRRVVAFDFLGWGNSDKPPAYPPTPPNPLPPLPPLPTPLNPAPDAPPTPAPAVFLLKEVWRSTVRWRTKMTPDSTEFRRPVRIICGDAEPSLNSGVARAFPESLPEFELFLVRGARHSGHLAEPKQVAR